MRTRVNTGRPCRRSSRAECLGDWREEGEVQGLRKAIVAVLSGRGLALDDDLRTALADSKDPQVLESVLRQAATATSAEILAVLRA